MENKSRLSEIPLVPFVTSGMVHLTLDKKGKKMDGGQKMSVNGTLYPAVHLFPLVIIDSVHHSAANAVSERNLKRHIVLFS